MSVPAGDPSQPVAPAMEDLSGELDYLKKQIIDRRDSFASRAGTNKTRAFRLRMTIVVLGAITTFVLGAKTNAVLAPYDHALSLVALFLSATVPAVAAWDAFYDHKWLWVEYSAARNALSALLDDLEYTRLSPAQITRAKVDALYLRYRAIVDDTNNAWQDKRTKIMDNGQERAE
jgi:hypothetical protein